MSICLRALFVAVAFAVAASALQAQPAPASAAASAAPRPKPAPRPMTSAERRDDATMPGDLRPDDPVIPQISVPLGRKQPPALPKASPQPPRARGAAAGTGGVDDTVARCEASSSKAARDACLRRLGKAASAP